MASSSVAAAQLAVFGNCPALNPFPATESDDTAAAESAAYDMSKDVSVKRHAACDDCRKRKMKCSGDPAGCERCIRHALVCHYSVQSKMGRPRKRQRSDDSHENTRRSKSAQPQPQPQSHPSPRAAEPALDPMLSEKAIERTTFENICNAPISQSIRRSAAAQYPPSTLPTVGNSGSGMTSHASSSTSPDDPPRTPPNGDVMTDVSYPTDVSLWPDFSNMTMLPMLVQDSHEHDKANHQGQPSEFDPYVPSAYPPDLDADPAHLAQLPSIPACPCLPNLYLTLSTLSTLSAFPVSSGTIDALLNAHRTGRDVVYCSVCLQRFQSGSQNIMLSSMLITVLADHWHRVKKATGLDLRKGFSTGDNGSTRTESIPGFTVTTDTANLSLRENLEWRTFGYQLVRAGVFGEVAFPSPPGSNGRPSGPSTPHPYTLSEFCSALERRQKQMHGLEAATDEFPARVTNDLAVGHTPGITMEEIRRCEDDARAHGDEGPLCLRLVNHAKSILRGLAGGPPRVDDL